MDMLQGVWKQHLRPRAVVGYGVKIFLPSPPNYVTRSPGKSYAHIPSSTALPSSFLEFEIPTLAIEVLHGSHIGWLDNEIYLHEKEHLFPWEKESIVPAIQHGCRAKPLFPILPVTLHCY